ncbi:hypothetical protein E2C01_036291 [Portunus trituberculatus]|uniref:Uncharacterized protein n=1 Tax=Portunus trituberculatus TaxID=210409 RepID=A0A5B7FDU1_PORTR|nr:hypothetical protein [Portunus trituberculatus]
MFLKIYRPGQNGGDVFLQTKKCASSEQVDSERFTKRPSLGSWISLNQPPSSTQRLPIYHNPALSSPPGIDGAQAALGFSYTLTVPSSDLLPAFLPSFLPSHT